MATKEFFTNSEELKKLMSAARATITAPFFGNNVEEIKSVSEAYKLAKSSPGTIELTGMPVYKPEKSDFLKVQINYCSTMVLLLVVVLLLEK